MMNTNRTLKLTTLALCGVINILGGTIALLLRLPVYLDSIGTVLAAALFGPAAGGAACHRSRCRPCIPQTPPVPYGRIPQRESFPPLHGLEAVSGSACDLTSGYCGKFHNHRGCFRWNYFLRLHCAGAAASQPRYESDSLCLRCTGHDRLCGSNDCPCGRPRDSARRFFCFRQSFYEKQKIICTNSTKNPAKNSLSFLQDSHILA